MLSISIRVQSPSGSLESLQLPADCTVANLFEVIAKNFKLPLDTFDLLWGYPPTVCSLPGDFLISNRLSANERIKVQLSDKRGKQAYSDPSTTPSTKNKGLKSKSQAQKPSPKSSGIKSSSRKSSSSLNTPQSTTFGAQIMTLTGKLHSNTSSRNHSISSSARIRKTRTSRVKGESTDICEALVSAVSSGSGSGRDKALRSVFRKAVAHQYDDVKAVARLAASYAGRYEFVEIMDSRMLGTGACTKMKVILSYLL